MMSSKVFIIDHLQSRRSSSRAAGSEEGRYWRRQTENHRGQQRQNCGRPRETVPAGERAGRQAEVAETEKYEGRQLGSEEAGQRHHGDQEAGRQDISEHEVSI